MVAVIFPESPNLLLPLIDKEVDVIIGAITQLLQDAEFTLSFIVCPDIEALCAFNEVFGRSDLQPN